VARNAARGGGAADPARSAGQSRLLFLKNEGANVSPRRAWSAGLPGLSVVEVARVLGVTRQTVAAIEARALAKCRKAFRREVREHESSS
jgi:DNA-directed RNA polymerase sigma subunit (sigma70/sigma32)